MTKGLCTVLEGGRKINNFRNSQRLYFPILGQLEERRPRALHQWQTCSNKNGPSSQKASPTDDQTFKHTCLLNHFYLNHYTFYMSYYPMLFIKLNQDYNLISVIWIQKPLLPFFWKQNVLKMAVCSLIFCIM